eukprot:gene15524-18438_t
MTSQNIVLLVAMLMIMIIVDNRVTSLTLTELKAQVLGKVITQSDIGYNDARTGYNSRLNRLPTLIVQVSNNNDVVLALEYAQSNGLQVSVKSGGHSAALLSVLDERVVIDVSQMKMIGFDRESMTVMSQPGNRWTDFYNYTIPNFNVGTPGGNCPSVGISGLTLGGGLNELASVYGAAVDNVLSMEIVLANGTIVLASNTSHTDLFWAMRGGGHGGFGIVTSLTYQVYNLRPAYYSAWITYNWADFDAVLNYVSLYATTMSNEVNLYFTGYKSGNASTPSVNLSCFSNGDPGYGESVCGVFRNISGVLPVSFYTSIQSYYYTVKNGVDPKARRSFTKGSLLTDLSPAAVKSIRTAIEDAPTSNSNTNTARLNLYWQGGEVLNKPRNATAFVHRTYPWAAVWITSYVPDSMTDTYHTWITSTYEQMSIFSSGEVYQNYPDEELVNWADAYYAENYPRLQAIKSAYDPSNFFSFSQSIRPLAVDSVKMTLWGKMKIAKTSAPCRGGAQFLRDEGNRKIANSFELPKRGRF